MKKVFAFLIFAGLIVGGCATKTQTGALVGSGVGAGVGGAIGGGKGALIGAAVGAVSGTVAGAVLDEQDRRIMENSSPRTVDRMDRREPLTVSDIIKLSQGGVSDQTIINYIDYSETSYDLSQSQVERLKKGGVSQRVINHMVNTGK